MLPMGGLFDIYVLSDDRSAEMVLRFLEHFLPRRKEAAVDYVAPHSSGRPEFCFDTAGSLLSHLEDSPGEPHAIYRLSEALARRLGCLEAVVTLGGDLPQPAR